MTNNILVSIIIPLFNSERFICETIKSASQQTWKHKEIIIVDDGSTDRSLLIAKKFESQSVKVVSKKKSGASSARNLGFSLSKGSFIQYLDADDLLDKEKIEKQLSLLINEKDSCIVSGGFRNFSGAIENADPIKMDNGCQGFSQPIDWLIEAAWDRAMFPPVVWLTPRKLIEEAGPWNETLSYNDDSEFFARVLLKATQIKYCDDAISYYRRGISTSLGSRKDFKARVSELDSLNLVTSHMLAFEDSSRIREACAFKYRKLIYSLYPEHPDLISLAQNKTEELGINGNYSFGNGITRKLNTFLGWKNAKLIQRSYRKIRNLF